MSLMPRRLWTTPSLRVSAGPTGRPGRPKAPAVAPAVAPATGRARRRRDSGRPPMDRAVTAAGAGHWLVPAANVRPYPTAAPGVRDRVRRQISPAPVPADPPRDGSQTGRKNPRADCRRIVPSPRRSRREIRRGSRSCAAPRSWRRGSWSVRPIRHRRAVRAIATAPAAPPATTARPARSARPRQ